jgi:hypothetical protein
VSLGHGISLALASGWLPGEDFDGAEGGGGAAFKAELFEDVHEVFFDGALAQAKNGGDVGIGFALGHPKEHFGFALGDAEGFQRSCTGEIQLGFGLMGLGSMAFETSLNRPQEFFARDGFYKVIVGTEVHAGAKVRLFASGGYEDERCLGGGRILTELLQDGVAVHFRHHDITEDKVGWIGKGKFEATPAVLRGGDLELLQPKNHEQVLS